MHYTNIISLFFFFFSLSFKLFYFVILSFCNYNILFYFISFFFFIYRYLFRKRLNYIPVFSRVEIFLFFLIVFKAFKVESLSTLEYPIHSIINYLGNMVTGIIRFRMNTCFEFCFKNLSNIILYLYI